MKNVQKKFSDILQNLKTRVQLSKINGAKNDDMENLVSSRI